MRDQPRISHGIAEAAPTGWTLSHRPDINEPCNGTHRRAQIAPFGAGLRVMPTNQAGAHSSGYLRAVR
jgi:hypothetical protein